MSSSSFQDERLISKPHAHKTKTTKAETPRSHRHAEQWDKEGSDDRQGLLALMSSGLTVPLPLSQQRHWRHSWDHAGFFRSAAAGVQLLLCRAGIVKVLPMLPLLRRGWHGVARLVRAARCPLTIGHHSHQHPRCVPPLACRSQDCYLHRPMQLVPGSVFNFGGLRLSFLGVALGAHVQAFANHGCMAVGRPADR